MVSGAGRGGSLPVSKLQWPKGLGFRAVVEKVTTNGVLTPLLWLVGVLNVPTMFLAYIGSQISWGFFVLSGIAVIWILKNYDYFREKSPNLLQSEKFQLAHQKQQSVIEAAMQGQVIEHEMGGNPQAHSSQRGEQNG